MRQLPLARFLEDVFEDGIMLIALLEILSGKKVPGVPVTAPKMRLQKINNLNLCFAFMKNECTRFVVRFSAPEYIRILDRSAALSADVFFAAIRLENIGAEDIVDKNLKLILGLIWTLILHYQIIMLRTGT
jgi:hypothetical protein